MAATGSEDNGRSAKRTKFDYLDGLIILVGEGESKFVLHQTTVCESSDFFRAACNGKWKESEEGIVRFPEVDPSIFTIYLGFLYTGEADLRINHTATIDAKALETMPQNDQIELFDRAISAYAFGEMVQDATFRNSVMDALRDIVSACKMLRGANIGTLCDKVSRRSRMVRFFIDKWACGSDTALFRTCSEYMPSDFIAELAYVSVEERDISRNERRVKINGRCFYHDHKDGSEKCK